MAFNISFMANQLVTDEDINAIGYNLSNTVYTTFTNDTLYGVDALNEITKHIVTAGVKRGYKKNCAVSINDTTVFINSGLAFFENGATITIDDDGINLTLEDSTETQYVYLFFNDTINVGGARCTTVIPSGLDCILLAEITGTEITPNMDRFCKSRILDAPNTPLILYNNQKHEEDFTEEFYVENLSGYSMIRVTMGEGAKYRMIRHLSGKYYEIIGTYSGGVVIGELSTPLFAHKGACYSNDNYAMYIASHPSYDDYYTIILYINCEKNIIKLCGETQNVNNEGVTPYIEQESIKIELFAGEVQ